MLFRSMVAGAIAAAAISPAFGAVTHLAAPDRDVLMNRTFDVVHATSSIPKCVRDEFASQIKSADFSMADPNQDFQTGQFQQSASLPYYRLVFAASTDGYYLIEALRGGSSPISDVFLFKVDAPKSDDSPFVIHQVHGAVPHSDGALVFGASPRKAKLVWSAEEDKASGDIDTVRKALVADKMNDSNIDITVPATGNPAAPGSLDPMATLHKAW